MSSTDVKIFEKEEFGSVRVVMQGDDPWFVASDVAKSLGYDNPANAINTHCKKINKITLSPDLGGREISSNMARDNAANTQPVLYSTPHSLIFRFHIISDEAR